MAEKAETEARTGRNGFDPEKLVSYVTRIENCEAQLDELRSEHMLKCKDVREDIKEILKEAHSEGVQKKAVKAAVAQRRYERKAKEAADGLDIDEQSQLEQIRHALGDLADTPLGHAAVAGGARNGARPTA